MAEQDYIQGLVRCFLRSEHFSTRPYILGLIPGVHTVAGGNQLLLTPYIQAMAHVCTHTINKYMQREGGKGRRERALVPREIRNKETFRCVVGPAQLAQFTVYLDHPPLPTAQQQRIVVADSQGKKAIDLEGR